MTLKAIADELNTTTMTIYRRLAKSGHNVQEIRDADTGEITTQGASLIASLFKNAPTSEQEIAIKQAITEVMTGNATGDNEQRDADRGAEAAQVAALSATVDGLRQLVAQIEGERDELRRQLAQVTAALQAEQADRQHERRLLRGDTGDAGQDQGRRGFFQRLFGR